MTTRTPLHRSATDYVLGIDPSLTGTGVAWVWPDGAAKVEHYGRKGRRDETLVERLDRIHDIIGNAGLGQLMRLGRGPALTVIESASHGSTGGSTWDRAGLWWAIVTTLGGQRIATCSPATRAKWATGTGRADKAAVAHAVGRLWPTVDIDCADCADAMALATIGAQHLGWDAPSRAHHEAARTKVRWPEPVETLR